MTNGDCCFNHIIDLPQKDNIDKPSLRLWKKIIFGYAVTQNGNANSSNKHIWTKKDTDIGISEFMLRFVALPDDCKRLLGFITGVPPNCIILFAIFSACIISSADCWQVLL